MCLAKGQITAPVEMNAQPLDPDSDTQIIRPPHSPMHLCFPGAKRDIIVTLPVYIHDPCSVTVVDTQSYQNPSADNRSTRHNN